MPDPPADRRRTSRAINCTFAAPGGRYEHYVGNIPKFGVDIGYTQGGVIIWTVVSPTAALVPGALAGNYVGATASATVGVGVGANALIGGFNNQITLQPLSIEANRGLNVGPDLVTQEFGWRDGNAFLTGAVYRDGDGNNFYTPGEGIGSVVREMITPRTEEAIA